MRPLFAPQSLEKPSPAAWMTTRAHVSHDGCLHLVFTHLADPLPTSWPNAGKFDALPERIPIFGGLTNCGAVIFGH